LDSPVPLKPPKKPKHGPTRRKVEREKEEKESLQLKSLGTDGMTN